MQFDSLAMANISGRHMINAIPYQGHQRTFGKLFVHSLSRGSPPQKFQLINVIDSDNVTILRPDQQKLFEAWC
jgi:hypothetical protein